MNRAVLLTHESSCCYRETENEGEREGDIKKLDHYFAATANAVHFFMLIINKYYNLSTAIILSCQL